jgi:HAD superfamily hydrolase (TIGR01509 family)
MNFRAILWDCDGVLIDSEVLACSVSADYYTRAGYPLTTSEYIRRFAGKSTAQIAAIIEEETGRDLAATIDWSQKEAVRRALFEAELQPIVGMEHLLKRVCAHKVLMAVASGSSLSRLEHSLRVTQLWDFFAPHIYSSEQVARGKPAPDIYLLAAEKLDVSPDRCLVIEDAEHGIRAGKAAGMTVYGFTGAGHCTAEWTMRADAVFCDATALQVALGTPAK